MLRKYNLDYVDIEDANRNEVKALLNKGRNFERAKDYRRWQESSDNAFVTTTLIRKVYSEEPGQLFNTAKPIHVNVVGAAIGAKVTCGCPECMKNEAPAKYKPETVAAAESEFIVLPTGSLTPEGCDYFGKVDNIHGFGQFSVFKRRSQYTNADIPTKDS